jgi:RNA polymerase sigma factor (sigma-70 family)
MSTLPESAALYIRLELMIPAMARSISRRLPQSIEVEDLEQSGRLALAELCRDYDCGRGETFEIYARMRVRGAMLDSIRGREYREASIERDAVREGPDTLRRHSDESSTDPWLGRHVDALPARQARVVELRYFSDLTQREAAGRLGCSRTTVEREEHLALAALRHALAA